MTESSIDKSESEPSMDPSAWNHYVRMISFTLAEKALEDKYRVMWPVLRECAFKILDLLKDPESGVDLDALEREIKP